MHCLPGGYTSSCNSISFYHQEATCEINLNCVFKKVAVLPGAQLMAPDRLHPSDIKHLNIGHL